MLCWLKRCWYNGGLTSQHGGGDSGAPAWWGGQEARRASCRRRNARVREPRLHIVSEAGGALVAQPRSTNTSTAWGEAQAHIHACRLHTHTLHSCCLPPLVGAPLAAAVCRCRAEDALPPPPHRHRPAAPPPHRHRHRPPPPPHRHRRHRRTARHSPQPAQEWAGLPAAARRAQRTAGCHCAGRSLGASAIAGCCRVLGAGQHGASMRWGVPAACSAGAAAGRGASWRYQQPGARRAGGGCASFGFR